LNVSSLGFNTGYIEELYRQYLENPESVSEAWREFFADYRPSESFVAAAEARPGAEAVKVQPQPQAPVQAPPQAPAPAAPAARESGDGALPEPVTPASAPPAQDDQAELRPIRGAQARIVENMEASLGVPTATSIRTVPVKLMGENRKLINDYQRYCGGEKVSFTHLIAWAVVKGIKQFPNMNTTLRHDDGTPQHVVPKAVNLGLAIDIERRGKRTLLVPNVKAADQMN